MSRESVAKIELDKAEVRLRKNSDLVRQLTELFKDTLSGADMSFTGLEKYVEINGKRYTEIELEKTRRLYQESRISKWFGWHSRRLC